MPPRPSALAASAPGKAPPASERNIYFYRANAGLQPSGQPVAVNLSSALRKLNTLACVDGGRYRPHEDDSVVCSWVDSIPEQRMRLATIRRSGLPLIEEAGDLTGLSLASNQGLYEPIHIQMFPNNILGVEFNFYGPRPSRLGSYLRQVTGPRTCPAFTLDPLLRQDVLTQVNRLQEVRVLELAIVPSYAEVVAEADRNLGAAFRAAARVGSPRLIALKLSPEPHGRSWLGSRVRGAVRALAGRPDVRENANTFKVTGLDEQTERVEAVDVLRDQLVASKRIVRLNPRSRALDDDAAYSAIEEAYSELKGELERAAATQVR